MSKKSIVANCVFKKSGTGNNGEWHLFEVAFQNNDKGAYFSNSNPQNYFIVGKEAEYTIEQKQNGEHTNYVVKPVKSKFGGGKAYSPLHDNKRCALTNAVNLYIAGKTIADKGKVTEMADILLKWLNNESQGNNNPPANNNATS